MRIIVYGAGAVGGVIGGRLAEHGHETILIARGAHRDAIARDGLTIQSPESSVTVPVPVVSHPGEIAFRPDDVVFLTMKTNDTLPALVDLLAAAGPEVPVVCVQNGVENERLVARRFRRVYAVPVRLPATHLDPGVVESNAVPRSGILDVGCYPHGVDDRCGELASVLETANFASRPEAAVMRFKYQKLLLNLMNAVDAACGATPEARPIAHAARDEGRACYRAAGIDCASDEEDDARRAGQYHVRGVSGAPRKGGSTWQSLARGKREVEVDYLNGEIVLLGRLHGVPTPVNATLQRVTNRMAREGLLPGSMSVAELQAEIAAAATG